MYRKLASLPFDEAVTLYLSPEYASYRVKSAFTHTTDDEEFASKNLNNKVRSLLYAHRDQYGSRRGVRLDIPSVMQGNEVVSIHAGPKGGRVIGYDHSIMIKDAEFHIQPAGAASIAGGGAKFPMAFIGGTIQPAGAPGGQRLFYNPRREHLFVDAQKRPVRGATKVWQIGKDTYASGIDYYGPGEAPEPPPGFNSAVKMP